MEYKYKVSICMIVKDCEADLQRCLDSFLPIIMAKDDDTGKLLSELIIIDTGSSDRTIKVAKKYTSKVSKKLFIPWSFSDARNYGIAKASGERIMIVDSDDELPQEALYPLMMLLFGTKPMTGTVFTLIKSFRSRDRKQSSTLAQPRIFDNDGKSIYTGAVHNKPRCNEPYVFADNVTFNHHGYIFQDKPDLIEKKLTDRSLPMLEENIEKIPTDLHTLNHLIKSYYIIHEHKKVIKYGEVFVSEFKKVEYSEGWRAYLESFIHLSQSYVLLGDIENAERIKLETETYSMDVAGIYFALGNYYASNQDRAKAKEYIEQGVTAASKPKDLYASLMSNNDDDVLPVMYNWLAAYYFSEGDFDKAGTLIRKGILSDRNNMHRWDIFNEPHCIKRVIKNELEVA